jgi:hypothetical protein
MCPENAITSRPDKSLSLKDFETACNLDEKTRPGPTSKLWLVCISYIPVSPHVSQVESH